MISVNELRAGVTFQEDGELYQVLAYEHIKMGRGSANIKIKARNVKKGSVITRSYINGASVQEISLNKRELQYLYKDSEFAYFMDPRSYEQISVSLKNLPGFEYLREGETAMVEFFHNEPLGLVLPPKVTLKIAQTDPGVKGNSTSNVYKDAVLENGVKTRVPLFINTGDAIVVDTRDGSYTKRA
jgi:elongation factor P